MSKTPTARTDLSALLGDLNAGVFEQQINAAISDVAANVVTHSKKGELVLKFTVKQIGESNQVQVNHSLKFVIPTARGRIVEESASETPLHVGRGGKLSLYPQEQAEMFPRKNAAENGSTTAPH